MARGPLSGERPQPTVDGRNRRREQQAGPRAPAAGRRAPPRSPEARASRACPVRQPGPSSLAQRLLSRTPPEERRRTRPRSPPSSVRGTPDGARAPGPCKRDHDRRRDREPSLRLTDVVADHGEAQPRREPIPLPASPRRARAIIRLRACRTHAEELRFRGAGRSPRSARAGAGAGQPSRSTPAGQRLAKERPGAPHDAMAPASCGAVGEHVDTSSRQRATAGLQAARAAPGSPPGLPPLRPHRRPRPQPAPTRSPRPGAPQPRQHPNPDGEAAQREGSEARAARPAFAEL